MPRVSSTFRQERAYAPVLSEEGWGARFLDREDEPIPAPAAPPLEVKAAPTAPITSQQAQRSKAEIQKMRTSLIEWLKYRRINDELASGKPLPSPLLKKPGARRSPVAVFAQQLHAQRGAEEGKLAMQLHQLLGEVFDPTSLPSPDLTKNPNAAVQLAEIAIAGKVPGELKAPTPQGIVWLWPLVIVVGVIAFVITSAIRSSADVAKERERLECIKQGACTDYGFWLKVGAVAFVGWIVWDRLGVGKRVTGALSGRKNPARARRRRQRRLR